MNLGRNQILSFIPHRDPFLFIDEIVGLKLPAGVSLEDINYYPQVAGAEVFGKYKVPENLNVFMGHFPGHPVLPGVLHLEIMAQTGCFTAYTFSQNAIQDKIKVALLGVEKAKFRKPIYPGAELNISAKLVKIRGIIQLYECVITSENSLISEATLMASLEVLEKGKIL